MRFFRLEVVALLFTVAALAQNDRGTITGTVSDPTGALVPSAAIAARNVETGAVYEAAATATGNYSLAQLPAAVYEMTVTAAGFARYVRQGLTVQVAQTERIDVVLQLAAAGESVTVTADAPLLRTDSTEMSQNLSTSRVAELPLYGARGAEAGLQNPYAFVRVMPGATLLPGSGQNNSVRVNGMPNDTFNVQIEGQESTFTMFRTYEAAIQPGVEALQEVALQTSNYSAEFGQVGGGFINFTAKSGTNELHGSAYGFLKNEFLNAGQPFSNNGNGHLVRPMARGDTLGGSVGGPVYIPHVYHGKNKTFFFVNFEYANSPTWAAGLVETVPATAFRNGDFSGILTGRQLATDPLGRPIMENTIYDPLTSRVVNGQVVTDPFYGNIIPASRISPIAAKIQAMFPLPTLSGLRNNYTPTATPVATPGTSVGPNPGEDSQGDTVTTFKIDHSISDKSKLSFYYSRRGNIIERQMDSIPVPLASGRENRLWSPTIRLNYDRTITPTFLLHVGAGFIRSKQQDKAIPGELEYDAPSKLGLIGGIETNFYGNESTASAGFPRINGLDTSFGGFDSILSTNLSPSAVGPVNADYYYVEKPSLVVSATLVRSNHTFKAGADWRKNALTDRNVRGSQGIWTFSNLETALPSTNGQALGGGAVGFSYASFLLGLADSASVTTPNDAQSRRTSWAMYVQDSWKVTRRLTLEYGLRWDYQAPFTELHDRVSAFSPATANPSAGGLRGAIAYAGSGAGRIGGEFTKNYPYAVGPRLGFAYQIAPKTVLRGGWGLTYSEPSGGTTATNPTILCVGNYNYLLYTSPTYGSPAASFSSGMQYTPQQLYGISLNPGAMPWPGQIQSPPGWIDPGGGRPPRINQWSIGLQREITANLVVEAAYVGNHSVWDAANSMNNLNALTPQRIASFGLDINNAADRTLLTSRLDSALAAARGFSTPPYASFPLSATVAQSLRPFPQFSTISSQGSPLGSTWYDALQMKLTKRTSYGLTVSSAFSWQDELQLGTAGPINNVFNYSVQKTISPYSLPFIFSTSISYQTPRVGPNRWVRALTSDWNIGVNLRYQSGLPIQVPAANNSLSSVLYQSTFANRVPGVPLFKQDINCHCFDPNKTFVLNPAAWSDPAPGQWGTAAAFYNDYRYQRRPNENVSLSRSFRIREGMRIEIRAMFFNMFNRTEMNDPDSSNALATQVVNATGQVVSGFGRINTGTTYPGINPRNGLLQARFQF